MCKALKFLNNIYLRKVYRQHIQAQSKRQGYNTTCVSIHSTLPWLKQAEWWYQTRIISCRFQTRNSHGDDYTFAVFKLVGSMIDGLFFRSG